MAMAHNDIADTQICVYVCTLVHNKNYGNMHGEKQENQTNI